MIYFGVGRLRGVEGWDIQVHDGVWDIGGLMMIMIPLFTRSGDRFWVALINSICILCIDQKNQFGEYAPAKSRYVSRIPYILKWGCEVSKSSSAFFLAGR